MSQMTNKMTRTWSAIVNWFEYGDLVPLIVIVSAVHYSMMLAAYDQILVAISIGLMVDLGHFRTVRAAVRYNGPQKRTAALRWAVACFMTAVSVVYQQRYYGDLWLSLPLPFLIVALAWLQHTDKPVVSRQKQTEKPVPEPAKKPKIVPKDPPKVDTPIVTDGKENGSDGNKYSKMTIDQIMQAEGVSRRTAYRRKEGAK